MQVLFRAPLSHKKTTSGCRVCSSSEKQAFTLIELLLSITILTMLMLIVTNIIGVVQRTWSRSTSKVSEFREARMAMDRLTRNLGQATLNAYYQSVDPLGKATSTFQTLGQRTGTVAEAYVRQSELQFVSGRASGLVNGAPNDYPGHAIFFQAPLGVTNYVINPRSTSAAVEPLPANTENMVNLLSGRGYFVGWGNDVAFRPDFLNNINTVPTRFRYRLLEYSPPAEKNRIYDSRLRPLVDSSNPAINNSKRWFQDDLQSLAAAQPTQAETAQTRAVLRPVAENVICLVLAPMLDSRSIQNGSQEMAPQYEYDSLMKANPGASQPASGGQGTQHLLPPLVKVAMVVVDSAAAEQLADKNNPQLRQELAAQMSGLFTNARRFDEVGSSFHQDLSSLESYLISHKLGYRVFTSTVIIKEARWSSST